MTVILPPLAEVLDIIDHEFVPFPLVTPAQLPVDPLVVAIDAAVDVDPPAVTIKVLPLVVPVNARAIELADDAPLTDCTRVGVAID